MIVNKDKTIEQQKYEIIARKTLEKNLKKEEVTGYKKFHHCFQSPLMNYEDLIKKNINSKMSVLEIGSGQGNFSALVARQAALITVSDISPHSLEVASRFLEEFDNVEYKEADMENLPFLENSFDVIVMSGSLSYGKFEIVKNQILKVLKDDGLFIFVDSLNNNPIYKYKRYLDILTGKRSMSTYKNLPTLDSIETLSNDFQIIDIKYFGSLTWIFKFFPDKKWVRNMSDSFDELIKCRKSAYKLTFIGKKFSS